MNKDSELSEEYCLKTYGISKSEVIEYARKRVYLIGMKSAFSKMITEDVSSGETPKKYPKLKRAYKKFEKDKSSQGSKAWEDIEQAYHEMAVKNYDVVVFYFFYSIFCKKTCNKNLLEIYIDPFTLRKYVVNGELEKNKVYEVSYDTNEHTTISIKQNL